MKRLISTILISSFVVAVFFGFTHFSTGQTLFSCVVTPNETCQSSGFLSFANYHLSAYKAFNNAFVAICILLLVSIVSVIYFLDDKNFKIKFQSFFTIFDKKVTLSFLRLRSYISLFELSPSRS